MEKCLKLALSQYLAPTKRATHRYTAKKERISFDESMNEWCCCQHRRYDQHNFYCVHHSFWRSAPVFSVAPIHNESNLILFHFSTRALLYSFIYLLFLVFLAIDAQLTFNWVTIYLALKSQPPRPKHTRSPSLFFFSPVYSFSCFFYFLFSNHSVVFNGSNDFHDRKRSSYWSRARHCYPEQKRLTLHHRLSETTEQMCVSAKAAPALSDSLSLPTGERHSCGETDVAVDGNFSTTIAAPMHREWCRIYLAAQKFQTHYKRQIGETNRFSYGEVFSLAKRERERERVWRERIVRRRMSFVCRLLRFFSLLEYIFFMVNRRVCDFYWTIVKYFYISSCEAVVPVRHFG